MTKIYSLFLFLLLSFAVWGQKKYKVIAYYTGNGETIRQYPVHHLTHIIYSFLALHNDSLVFRYEQQQQTIRQLVQLKKDYPQLKVMVSIGGWGGCAPCSDLFASADHRNNFAKTVVELFKQYDIDGLDLDWEYPAIEGYPGHTFSPTDKSNFTELVKSLRKEMGNNYLLSFAAGGFSNYLEQSIDWNAVMPLVNFVTLMTYDLVNGYSTVTGHHTPLAGYQRVQQSTDRCVNWLLKKKVPPGKLIIGAAFYARVWKDVEATHHGLFQQGNFSHEVAYRNYSSYFSDSSGFKYYWDRKAKAPWQYNLSDKLYATFDDERSIGKKANFIRRKKLGGIMFWELTQDKPAGGLIDVINNGLNK